mmetsp:Transcript_2710/g.5812  ORF Transcript_2710/g.5812 Transcript_2710/m.5812 type:complete len:111 (-) Transcript_2710:13-345(-)
MSLVLPPAKRARVEEDDEVAGGEISTHVNRSSQLAAPTMLFSGHQAAVYTCKFDPTGQYMASGSHDKSIFREYMSSRGRLLPTAARSHMPPAAHRSHRRERERPRKHLGP